jgi:hypothetical protein
VPPPSDVSPEGTLKTGTSGLVRASAAALLKADEVGPVVC